MAVLLENNGGLFMDEKWLPLDKAAMKTAFKIALTAERDGQRIDWLKTGWLLLADFQPGIGDTPISLPPMPEKLTDESVASLKPYTDMTKIVADESLSLTVELETFLAQRRAPN